MEIGFIVGKADYGQPTLADWVEGAPQKSVWTGLGLKGRDAYLVRTFRCTRCGYLESYAVNREP